MNLKWNKTIPVSVIAYFHTLLHWMDTTLTHDATGAEQRSNKIVYQIKIAENVEPDVYFANESTDKYISCD